MTQAISVYISKVNFGLKDQNILRTFLEFGTTEVHHYME